MRTMLTILIGILTMISTTVPPAFAGSTAKSIQATASVSPYVRYNVLQQYGSFVVTDSDRARGYVDLERALQLSVMTNSRSGYRVSVALDAEKFTGITFFDGMHAHAIIGSHGEIHMPFQGTGYVTKDLAVRVYLREETAAGTYPWPMALMIHPM